MGSSLPTFSFQPIRRLLTGLWLALLPLAGWGQASLPAVFQGPWAVPAEAGLSTTLSTGSTTGDYATELGSSTKGGSAKLQAVGNQIIINFNSAATGFSFVAKANGSSTGAVLSVEESDAGSTYAPLLTVNTFSTTTAGATITAPTPKSTTRYIRFTLTSKVSGTNIGLDYISLTAATPVAAPTITSFTPANGPANTAVTINGTNFTAAATVAFNGTAATVVTFVNASQLTATVPVGATTGPVAVAVGNATATSATNFTVDPTPAPTITSLSPSTVAAGGAAFTLTVNGSNFVSGATATFNNNSRTTTYVSATQLTVAIPAADVATAGTYNVAVSTAAAGGGTTAATTASAFTVTAPATSPLLLYTFTGSGTVAPDAPPASSSNVTGSSFSRGSGLGRSTATGAYVATGLDATGATSRRGTDYLAFSLAPNSNYVVSLSSLKFDDQAAAGTSGGSPATTVQVLYSLTTTFTNPVLLATQDVSATATTTHSLPLSGITALQNVPASSTVYFRIYPYGANASGTTYRLDNVQLEGSFVPTATFYAKPTGDLNALATFGPNTDGSGPAPTSFTANNTTYTIAGTGRSLSAAWAVAGTNSKAVLATGASFTIPASYSYTGPLDLQGTAYLTVLTAGAAPTFGALDVASTVDFAQATDSYVVPIPANGYGNLKLTNGSKQFSGSNTSIFGNLTIENVANVGAASTTYVALYGNLTLLGTTTFDPTATRRFRLGTFSPATQTFSGNGNTLRLFTLETNTATNNIVLADANGGTPLEVGSTRGGGISLINGSTLALNSNTLSFTEGGAATINLFNNTNGTLTLSPGSSLNLESTALNIGFLQLTPNYTTLNNFRLVTAGGDNLPVQAPAFTVNGILTLGSTTTQLALTGNQAVAFNGTITGPGSVRGTATTDLTLGGSGDLGSLTFAAGYQALRSLTLNRAGGGTATLGSPLALASSLTLTNGLLATTATNVPTLAAGATAAGGSATSFVNGPLRQTVADVSAATSFTFPIGKGNAYRPLTLNVATQTSTTIYQAEQFNQDGGTRVVAPLQRASRLRYFTLTPYNSTAPATITQPGGFSGSVSLSFGADDQVADPSATTLVVGKRADSTQPWASIGGSGSGTASSGTLTSGPFSSFSDFALGSTAADATANPLPVQLSSLTAIRTATGVQLAWGTAAEVNSAHFEVERSADGQAFASVTRVAAQGSTAQAHTYAALDGGAPAARLYYRLRQVDRDGSYAYSPTVSVAATAGATAEITLSPNPAHDAISLLTELPTAYTLRNALGQVLRSGTTAAGTTTLPVAELPVGVYFCELHTGTGRVVRKFAKE